MWRVQVLLCNFIIFMDVLHVKQSTAEMLISLAQIKMEDTLQNLGNPAIPNPFGTRDWFHGTQYFHGPGSGGWLWDDSSHPIYCALYFYCYYINSTSDHQALDPTGWGPHCNWHSTSCHSNFTFR